VPAPAFVRTVLGDVPPTEIGLTLTHEHLLTRPAKRLQDGGDLLLDSRQRAVEELRLFRQAGGSALVELTVAEFGRDAAGLRQVSETAQVHVIATTGHVSLEYWDGVIDVDALPQDALVEEMVSDLTVGIDGSTVRAGIVKAGSSRDHITPAEERVLRAAAQAQRITGAPITTHTTAGTMAREQAAVLADAGADPRRVCLGHLDRQLDRDLHHELAAAGFTIGYDGMSKDWYTPDSQRVDAVRELVEAGLGDRVCLSGDLARRSQLVSWGGGPGYTYIPWRIVPWLRRAGLDDEQIRRITIDNPRRLLTWEPGNRQQQNDQEERHGDT
jgi:5-phospho-D-xylono-1,4-lactonase